MAKAHGHRAKYDSAPSGNDKPPVKVTAGLGVAARDLIDKARQARVRKSVGDVKRRDDVDYYEGDKELLGSSGHGSGGTRWHAAKVTRVLSPTCVNLVVFFDASGPQVRQRVEALDAELLESGAKIPEGGWLPDGPHPDFDEDSA